MAISPSQRRAVAKYNAANYERVELRLPKGRKAEVEQHAQEVGETLNGYINTLICDNLGVSREEWGLGSNAKTLAQLRRILNKNGYDLQKRDKGQDSWMIVISDINSVVAGGDVYGLTTQEVQEWVDDLLEEIRHSKEKPGE